MGSAGCRDGEDAHDLAAILGIIAGSTLELWLPRPLSLLTLALWI
jgi:hypothetical protein